MTNLDAPTMASVAFRVILMITQAVLIVTLFRYDLEDTHVPHLKSGLALLASAVLVIIAEALRIMTITMLVPGGVDTNTIIVLLHFAHATQTIIVIRMIINICQDYHRHTRHIPPEY